MPRPAGQLRSEVSAVVSPPWEAFPDLPQLISTPLSLFYFFFQTVLPQAVIFLSACYLLLSSSFKILEGRDQADLLTILSLVFGEAPGTY